jgi:hypothetical protein
MLACRIAASLTLLSFAAYGQAWLDNATIGKLVKAGVSDKTVAETIARNEGDSAASTAPTALALHDGTPVRLRLTRDLTFTNIKPGDTALFEVVDDLRIDGLLVMARGRVPATITEVEPKTRMGRGGKLGVNLSSLTLLNGAQVAIRAAKESPHSEHAGDAAAAVAGIVKPAAASPLFIYGRDDSFPEGTTITVYIDGETRLDPACFLVDIAFTSNPSGALVSMYGAPIGRTPFITRLSPGTYKVVYSVDGYTDLTQTIRVGPGYSNTVHAAFELKP